MQSTPYDSASLDGSVEDLQFKIEQYLIANNYRLGTYQNDGRVEYPLSSGGIRVSVKPEYSPHNGDHTVVVTPISIQSWTKRPNKDWIAIGTGKSYDTPEELLELLPQFTTQNKGAW